MGIKLVVVPPLASDTELPEPKSKGLLSETTVDGAIDVMSLAAEIGERIPSDNIAKID